MYFVKTVSNITDITGEENTDTESITQVHESSDIQQNIICTKTEETSSSSETPKNIRLTPNKRTRKNEHAQSSNPTEKVRTIVAKKKN